MRTPILAACGLLLSSCAAPHQIRDRSDYLAEATRTYQNETRERIIGAAETVLKISDPQDFEFRHNINGFTGLRRYTVYAVLAAAQGREKWEFQTEPVGPNAVRASISVSEAGRATGGYSSTPYENEMASVPLYRLFWSRVDYVLGKRPDWIACDQAAKEEESKNTNTAAALGGLCGPTSDGRDAPPPPPLPPIAVASGAKPRR